MSNKKLNDDVLDQLICFIADESLSGINHYNNEFKLNLSESEKVEYLARAYTEILGAIITACPENKTTEIYKNICNFLQKCISVEKLKDDLELNLTGKVSNKTLENQINDLLYLSKKATA